ncbi:hypothetical protein [Geoglobus sp.]
MRLFAAIVASALLGYHYYTTQDYLPLATFVSLYAAYEIISRASMLGILKPAALFALSAVFLQTATGYVNLKADAFIYVLSAGIALSFGTSGLRYRGYLAVAGSGLIAASILLLPDIPPITAYRMPMFLAAAALGITSALPMLSERFEFLLGERLAILVIVLAAGLYYSTLRGGLMPGLKSLGDWIIVAAILFYFLGKLRLEVQEVAEVKDLHYDFESMAERAEKEYVDNGNPVPLAVFVAYNLARAGTDMKTAEKILSSIIDGERLPKYAFGFERELILKRRKWRRIERISELKKRIERIGGDYGD